MDPCPDLLPLGQRLAQYRQLAEDALQRARVSTDRETRTDLLSLAASWNFLADELEKAQAGSGAVVGDGRPGQH